MRRIDFIINPISGTRSKTEIPALVNELFPADKFDARIHVTAGPGQGYKIALESINLNSDTIVAIGGDGTVNEIARALVNRTRVKFGIVPMGSGNGLARHGEIPKDLREALLLIREGHSELIDYGDVNGQIFLTTAGTGFDADVGEHFSHMGTRGPLTYGRAILEKAILYKPRKYTIYADNVVKKCEAYMITVANAAQWGNNLYVAPQASQQDGLFNVAIVKPYPVLLGTPAMAIDLINGHFDENEHVDSFQTRHLRIESEELGCFHVDGEPIMFNGPVDITIHPFGLRIIVPRHRSNRL